MGSYLLAQPWSVDFDMSNNEVQSVVVWIHLPGLLIHLYHKQVLRAIGDVVGNVVKVDYNTSDILRGKFARLAISVNLKEPLVAKFLINGREQLVDYEYLPDVCFHYGRYGHNSQLYMIRKEQVGVDGSKNNGGESGSGGGNDDEGNNGKGEFGPWMVVSRRGGRAPRTVAHVEGKGGSRF
ncbi:hypothetical protein P3X46_001623 [Hevea brasiliensis]|uniref:DUF4283 domain-containing protein n=1 Tax=Hevea brasiliensis TaxID=3981 RepID=A0ABQ9NDV2_HEVBR|nr:uncharacterized protein LOC110634293 [Hevea brasiliensis]KAJ9190417.1 hypothetical protein P3X46_001623 [Hevea brasiliensis]